MKISLYSHTATLLRNGEVLIAGGTDVNNMCCVSVAELYNPHTGIWSNTGTMTDLRAFHTAVLLSNGMVLAAGGQNISNLGTAEIYNPFTGKWTATPDMHSWRMGNTETLLPNGTVLVTGGGYPAMTSAEVFTPGRIQT